MSLYQLRIYLASIVKNGMNSNMKSNQKSGNNLILENDFQQNKAKYITYVKRNHIELERTELPLSVDATETKSRKLSRSKRRKEATPQADFSCITTVLMQPQENNCIVSTLEEDSYHVKKDQNTSSS